MGCSTKWKIGRKRKIVQTVLQRTESGDVWCSETDIRKGKRVVLLIDYGPDGFHTALL